MKVLFLGTGPSLGVPIPTCTCQTCTSENDKDKRLRSSIYVKLSGAAFVIDCGPDFRQQVLKYNISKINFILLTHKHNDHIAGLDDLRPYNFFQKKDMRIYGSEEVLIDIKKRFYYSFDEDRYPGAPVMELEEINKDSVLEVDDYRIIVIEGHHGTMPVYGYRIGEFAYLTDFKYISREEIDKLQGVKVLVVNALRPDVPHKLHFDMSEALSLVDKIKPEKVYLTHLSHHWLPMDRVKLPENVFLAYDGLQIKI